MDTGRHHQMYKPRQKSVFNLYLSDELAVYFPQGMRFKTWSRRKMGNLGSKARFTLYLLITNFLKML